MEEEKHSVLLIKGKVHTGKFSTGGFLCPGTFDKGARTEFILKNTDHLIRINTTDVDQSKTLISGMLKNKENKTKSIL